MRTKWKRITTKIIAFVLAMVVALGTAFAAPAENVEAAVTAKSLVASALKYMESYDSISYTIDATWNKDGEIRQRTGMLTSDSKTNHGFYLDPNESQGGWENYRVKDKVYRKAYNSTSWTIYTVTDDDSDSFDLYSFKNYIEYLLGHLKKLKITSKGKKSYTITAKPDFATDIKKVTLTINKEEKCITNIKLAYKTYTDTYLDSTDTYTVKNKVNVYSNICYGMGSIKLPSGL